VNPVVTLWQANTMDDLLAQPVSAELSDQACNDVCGSAC